MERKLFKICKRKYMWVLGRANLSTDMDWFTSKMSTFHLL